MFTRENERFSQSIKTPSYANHHDLNQWGKFESRAKDWRNGALVYQIIVDRFVPSPNLDDKLDLYPAPKKLRSWDELPAHGHYLRDYEVWSHELDFFGGDLASTHSRLDYLKYLGADVLYLCPINPAWTNHGYDATDHRGVRREYGTEEDLTALAKDLHDNGMRLVLDGVFNHIGRQSPVFQEAINNPQSPYRSWFDIVDGQARGWANVKNLPELVLENQQVADYLWQAPDSVVRSWLRAGVDGWRLDVSYEIGMTLLGKITQAAHLEKPNSLVLGEMPNYPANWFPELDGVLNFPLREILINMVNHQISAPHAARMLTRLIADANFEHLLKSWNYLDNHDTARITDTVPDEHARKLAATLMFTLPGSMNIYYGSEIGMSGGDEPACRAPMRWDWVNEENKTLEFFRKLIQLRKTHRALRIGDISWLETEQLFGFERLTDQVEDSVIVLANPSEKEITESVMIPDSKLMDLRPLTDLFTGRQATMYRSLLRVTLAPQEVLVMTPDTAPVAGYTPYKRVQ